MVKVGTAYRCRVCDSQSPVPMGRCPRCGEWGTMEAKKELAPKRVIGLRRGDLPLSGPVLKLEEVDPVGLRRIPSGVKEVDRVLGGGWVPGMVLLLAGEPGIGKSTLLLQLAHLAAEQGDRPLYIAGEESLSQIKLRAERIGVAPTLSVTREVDARTLAEHLRLNPQNLVVVDSVQTLVAEDGATPGTFTQVRDSTALLSQAAKESDATLVLIGHITKQGSIAGPKVIEHMVDATLVLESASGFRILRALKNRFGPAGEVGVFEMREAGLTAVPNPSEAFLAERQSDVSGSVVVAALEGQRPLLLEVQALAAKSPYPSPRRVVQGLDQRRVDVVLAVLERRVDLPLTGLDVFVNVAGGLRLTDPGTDLAVALAVYSAVMGRPLPKNTAVVGEVGLTGEIRSVAQLGRRVQEAKRSGYRRLIGPAVLGVECLHAQSLAEALAATWQRPEGD
ncbi:MAG: DNA repair protein RadA [Truepera sp.]|nr:DNA repair protein RadA [Truepera sp.]